MPGGYIPGGDLASFKPITSFGDDYFGEGVESVKHAWYDGGRPAAPLQGRDHAALHRLPGRRQVFLGQGADLLRQAARRSARSRACWAWWPPATSRPRSTSTRRWTPSRRWPRPRSRSTRCTRPSAATPPARCAARCMVEMLAKQWQLLIDNIGKGDIDDLQPAGVPQGRDHAASASTRRRAACCRTGS